MTRIRKSFADLREVIGIVWQDADHFVRVRFAFVFILVLITSALTPLGPVALKMIVDRLAGDEVWSIQSVAVFCGFYAASLWLSRSLGEVRRLAYSRAERRMFRAVSARLFAHVMRLPLRFHLNRRTGAIGQSLDNGLQGYQLVLQAAVFTLLPVAVQLGTIAFVLLHFEQSVFLLLFAAAAVCYATAFGILTTRLSRDARAASTAHVDASAVMTDSILNYETVKFFAAERVVQDRVGRAFVQTENAWAGFYRRSLAGGITVATIFASFLAMSLLYGAHQVKAGHMTVGDFVLVNTYMLQVMAPLEVLGTAIQGLAQGLAMLDTMLSLLREKPEPLHATGNGHVVGSGQLEFERVCLAYAPDRPVLRDVSFKVPAGKSLGIVGASGAGKSTLIRLLVRLLEPDDGRILLDDLPIAHLSLPQLRSAVAVVPQDTVLFNDSIAYNIAFGRQGATRQEVVEAARIARLHDFIMSLPDRYDTHVGERGTKLSGGEKQRVSIARAVIRQPRIYVFDEATSSLDSRTEQEILSSLREISRTSTTLIIAHRLSTVVHADEIVALDNGSIVERGSHESLVRLNGFYAALWHAQREQAEARCHSRAPVPGAAYSANT